MNEEIIQGNPSYEMMTIFYRLATGEIKEMCSGEVDYTYFGDESDDYALIWGFIHIPMDEYVRANYRQFIVDLETKELCMKPVTMPNTYRML